MKYAWVENGIIRDLVKDVVPSTVFHPDIAVNYSVQLPNSARVGDAWDGTTLTPKLDPVPPAVVPSFTLVVSPMEFQFLFTNAERIAIAASVDVNIASIRGVLADPRIERIDLSANYIVDYFDLLQTAGLITNQRKNKMLAGKFPRNT